MDLKTNILRLVKMDDQVCITILRNGFLIVHDKFFRLLTKTKKTKGNIYQLKIKIRDKYNMTKEDNSDVCGYGTKDYVIRVFYTLQDMIRGNIVKFRP